MCYVLAILGIIAIVGAQYNYGFDPRTTIVKRQSSSLPLTGVHNPDGTLGLRREVDDLATDPTTWNLFMLGLDMMQWTDQSDIESWYQVMGNIILHLQSHTLMCPRNPWPTVRALRQRTSDITR